MSIIVLLPAFLAAFIALIKSPHQAFIFVYVPVLLFLPNYYHWKILGIPDPTFATATILPIIVVWVARGLQGWRFSFMDILVIGFAFAVLYSESLSQPGRAHYQNFIINFSAVVVCPYLLAKSLIEPAGLREAFAKSIVIVLFLVAILMVYQFVTKSPYTLTQSLLGRFFGGEGWLHSGRMRWGFRRVPGPYGHEILAGIVFWIGYRIQRWLEWNKAWSQSKFAWLKSIPVARLLTLGILIGGLTTLVRGPLVGAIIAAFVPLIGLSKKRWLIFWILVALFIIAGIPLILWFINYASIDPSLAETQAHQTVAYRWQLVVDYFSIAMEQAIWGWGRFGAPVVSTHQWSIDNHFLLLFLNHGLVGLSFFVAIFLTMLVRLFIHSMSLPLTNTIPLGFTLLSLYVLILVSVATVWLGQQTLPLFFLIVGWSEGYLLSGKEKIREEPKLLAQKRFQFRRLL